MEPELLPELWDIIFAKGTPHDFRGLQLASRWTNALFWNHRRECDSVDVAVQCNPARLQSIRLTDLRPIERFALSKLFLPGLHTLVITGSINGILDTLPACMPNLRTLEVHRSDLVDADVQRLCVLERLSVLVLAECGKLTEESHDHIGRLTSLTTLMISSSPSYLLAQDKGYGVKAHRDDLDALRDRLGDCAFGPFTALQRLDTFDSGPFVATTPAAIGALCKLPALKHLRLQQCQLVDNTGLAMVATMTTLAELHLYKCQFADSFACLATLAKLKSLSLRGCFIRNADLVAIARAPALERLDISDCPKVTDDGVRKFLQLAVRTKLKWIKMANCRCLLTLVYEHWLWADRIDDATVNWRKVM